jgi:hypothetical protein
MTLTYEETFQLAKDETFRGRVAVACTKFAAYITDEDPSTPAHPTRYKWAQNTLVAPEVAANLVIPTAVWDDAVQTDGDNVSDEALQGAVETAVQKLI